MDRDTAGPHEREFGAGNAELRDEIADRGGHHGRAVTQQPARQPVASPGFRVNDFRQRRK